MKAKAIKSRIQDRLASWRNGDFQALVDDTIRSSKIFLDKNRGTLSREQRAKIFSRLLLRGKIREAVRFITEREGCGALHPTNIDAKSKERVIDVLHSKHPDPRVTQQSTLTDYESLPAVIPVRISEETVDTIARRLSGSAGPGGTDAINLQHWLLRHGMMSQKLQTSLAKFATWLATTNVPWAAIRALMSARLIGLDKNPGVRPVGVGDIWRRITAKCIIHACGNEATLACGSDQLCAGLRSGIEGAIHSMRVLWREHHSNDQWGHLLIDARNAFNELDRAGMLWTVRHTWPSGSQFVFNCYKHYSRLVVRGLDGTSSVVLSKVGVTQGDPLAMIAYGLGILPLIKLLQKKHPSIYQPWYADDGSAAGSFQHIKNFFTDLQILGPQYGYFPETTKSILVVSEKNVDPATTFFSDLGFQVVTGARFLGGYIGNESGEATYISDKVNHWSRMVTTLSEICSQYPQEAYTALIRSVQAEWLYLLRVSPGAGQHFGPIESTLSSKFLPALLQLESITPNQRELFSLPVKHSGLAIPIPTVDAETHLLQSTVTCGHLISSLRRREEFCLATHTRIAQEGMAAFKARRQEDNEKSLTRILQQLPPAQARTIARGSQCGNWLTVYPSTVAGTHLYPLEFRDGLSLRYNLEPKNLPDICDGCGMKFTSGHALQCRTGGLIIARHNDIKDELAELCGRVFKPSEIHDEPAITHGRAQRFQHPSPATQDSSTSSSPPHTLLPLENDEDRGDLNIRGFWKPRHECIIDVRVVDTDAPSYTTRKPESVLRTHELQKKKKYLQRCLDLRRHFTPFILSVDGLLAFEAQQFVRRLAVLFAEKWHQPYSVVCGWIRARLSLAALRATHHTLRGSPVPFFQSKKRHPQWDDGTGLGLHRCG